VQIKGGDIADIAAFFIAGMPAAV
jgi:hypothetical protein